MSFEAVSEPVKILLKQVFKGYESAWPEKNDQFIDTFLHTLNFHGLTPVFWHWINQHRICSNWPDTLLSEIKKIALQEAASDLLIELELKQILQAMADIDVHPVLIKGTPLSFSLYPRPGLRPRCDTDLLIADKDIDKTAQLMRQSGHESLYDGKVALLSSQMTFTKQGKLDTNHVYDMHWRINNRNRSFNNELNYFRLSASGVKIPRLGSNAMTLGHIDALLLACFHRAGHFSQSGDYLIWLYDIHLLVQKMAENELLQFCYKAQQLKIIGLCADAIMTAQEWFSTDYSDSIQTRFRTAPKSETSMAYLIPGRLEGIRNHTLLELKQCSTWKNRVRLLLQKAFPPVNYMIWRYEIKNKYLVSFYYIYRMTYGFFLLFIRPIVKPDLKSK